MSGSFKCLFFSLLLLLLLFFLKPPSHDLVALAFSVSSNVYISVLFVQTDEAVLAKAVCFHYFQFHIGNSDTQQSAQRSKKKKKKK